MFLTIITFIIVLGVLVFVHELGHFLAARKFGVKAEEFGFGFPPRMFGVYKDKQGKWKRVIGGKEVKDAPGTIYSLNWIPIGGFVKIKGEDAAGDGSIVGGSRDTSEDKNSCQQELEQDSLVNKPIWQRAIIMSAGVTMNIVLAAALIIFGLSIGMPQVLDGIHPKAQISDKKIQVVQVYPDSPASQAGIIIGDAIISINNVRFVNYEELQKFVDENQGKELDYIIGRDSDEMLIAITPEIRQETSMGGIGIAIAETGIVKYPWYLAIAEGVKTTVFLTWAIIAAFYELFKGLIAGHGLSADIAGPVGIAALTGQMARMGFVYVLQFAALLSINLAIINFLPFPALDGGRVLFLFLEKIKGRPVKRELEAAIHQAGLILLMLLVLVVTFKDVARFGDNFKMLWDKIAG
ncbi:RIP metalloprotease RseP [Patescibacteria group bacterium]|nr:RIP metalloprotease RseP [Candidatus Falkowbacteria bacterium]MBU3905515.1 RIP metalloprotease RseP [Patescibacteria group bacterium]MBU4014831.1 RIP metalloprotease RseP [Patescibacteria group bacterium]MBU4026622.1 RIP metalloprotease RseP [Patescibacteria group bacterium]MBU4073521.1 RIP metalloprotease RseP [Patescibacteria group bacterium]